MQAMALQGCQAGSLSYLELSSYPTNLLGLQSSEEQCQFGSVPGASADNRWP